MTDQVSGASVNGAPSPKVSVIMPVYAVEAYVERAVRSVLDQTLGDFELLAVDDGSPDASGAILDGLSALDPRVRVFHQQNKGAPAARNFAIDRASGEYLMFMDADDWLEPEALERMAGMCDRHGLDLAVAGFYIDTYCGPGPQDHLSHKLSVPSRIFEDAGEFRRSAWELFDKNQLYPPWNKLYRREYIVDRGLRFPDTFWDDFPFVLSVIRDVEKVGVTDEAYYHFIRARAESETSRYRSGMYEKREEEHAWMLELYEHWGVDDEASMEMIHRRYAERLIGCIENVVCPDSSLGAREQRAEVARMISTPQARLAVAKARPHSRMMALMLLPIARQRPLVAYWEGKLVSFVKRRFSKLFATLKARR